MNFLNKFIKKFQSSEKNLEQSATNNLKISPNLDEFVKKELVPGLNISSDYFWKTFEDIVERFSERNRELLNERENLQSKIDDWHIQNKDFTFCVELPIKAHRASYKICTTKSFERSRIAGKKKVNAFKDGLKILFSMIKLFFRHQV